MDEPDIATQLADAPPPDPLMREATKLRWVMTWLLILHAIVAIYFGKEILLPIALGIMLALTLSPVVRGAARLGVPSPITALLLVAAIGGGGFLTVFSMSDNIARWVDDAPRLGALVRIKLAALSESVEAVKNASEEVGKIADAAAGGGAQEVVVAQPGFLSAALGNVASAGTSVMVAFVLALFILSSGRLFYTKLVQAFPRFRDKRKALMVVYEIETRISRYLLTITAINAGLGALIGVAFYFIGMPYAHLWALAAFLLNYMPFIGTAIGTMLSAAIAIITFDTLGYAALAPLTYVMLGSVEGQMVTPMVLGRRMEINTVAVFLALIFWTWVWGVAGALLAVPILVLFKAISDRVEGMRGFGQFLSAGGEQAPEGPNAAAR
ncbi:MAG: AI-2E family transporter [Paracoccaceae bacterium]